MLDLQLIGRLIPLAHGVEGDVLRCLNEQVAKRDDCYREGVRGAARLNGLLGSKPGSRTR